MFDKIDDIMEPLSDAIGSRFDSLRNATEWRASSAAEPSTQDPTSRDNS
jgi:hypothetical protein